MIDIASITARTPDWEETFAGGLPSVRPVGDRLFPSVSPYPGFISERILPSGERQVYTDVPLLGKSALYPSGDQCILMATPQSAMDHKKIVDLANKQTGIAPALKTALNNSTHLSACLSTERTFFRGYFECNVSADINPGMWWAFWLFSRSKQFEIDIQEGINANSLMYSTIHNGNPSTPLRNTVINKMNKWHTYGALWEDGIVTFYLDRKPVGSITFTKGADGPANMVLNVAVGGGNWAQKPDPACPYAIKIAADYMRWWKID